MSPNPEGGGYINFGADPVRVGVHFFVSVHYLLNQLMDFDQTCIYIDWWKEGKSLLNFSDLYLILKDTGHFEMSKIRFPCVIF